MLKLNDRKQFLQFQNFVNNLYTHFTNDFLLILHVFFILSFSIKISLSILFLLTDRITNRLSKNFYMNDNESKKFLF